MWTVDESHATAERPSGMGIRFRFAEVAERTRLENFVEQLMVESSVAS
jgi:hypothetical protein